MILFIFIKKDLILKESLLIRPKIRINTFKLFFSTFLKYFFFLDKLSF